MSNMSYCRFENTSKDLRDCVNAINNGETEDLNDYETDGLEKLLELCRQVVDQADNIEEIIKERRNCEDRCVNCGTQWIYHDKSCEQLMLL